MTRIPVFWLEHRCGWWDQNVVSVALSGPQFLHMEDGATPPTRFTLSGRETGCVLVVPGRFYGASVVNAWLAVMPWCVVVVTSDEEGLFDLAALEVVPERHRVFAMTPRPDRPLNGARPLGEGYPPGTSEVFQSLGAGWTRPHDVWFGGQVTHKRRERLVEAIDALPGHVDAHVDASAGFTEGLPRHEYLLKLARTKVAPCPAGPATPDSFRLYEALEAGCMPIVEDTCGAYASDGFWPMLYPAGAPFLVVHDWASELAKTVHVALDAWPGNAARAQAWWCAEKAKLRRDLERAVADVGGPVAPRPAMSVIVTVSPTSDPTRQLAIIEATVASVRERAPHAPMFVVCDGVRDEQEHLTAGYHWLLHRISHLCCHDWQAVPIMSTLWRHQAGMVKLAMDQVDTDAVLLVEQDTPLEGEIPLDDLAALVASGEVDLVRFHHESEVLDVHRHLMVGRRKRVTAAGMHEGQWIWPTVQWSQRPHVASTGRYRTWLAAYFGSESRTMIEDAMHGVVHNAWLRHGQAGWQQFRLALYAPHGNMRRSHHLDGRGAEPKYPMTFAYDGATPEGAPAPGTR